MNQNGGVCVNLQELKGPVIPQHYEQTWEREYLDLTELARLRWAYRWKLERLAEHFGVSRTAIKERLRAIKDNPERVSVQVPKKVIRGR